MILKSTTFVHQYLHKEQENGEKEDEREKNSKCKGKIK